MNEFDMLLMRQGLYVYLAIIAISSAALAAIASRFTPNIRNTIWVAAVGVPLNIAVAAISVFVLAVSFRPIPVLGTLIDNPVGALSYFLETGGEFAPPTIVMSILFFAWIQARKSKRTRRIEMENAHRTPGPTS